MELTGPVVLATACVVIAVIRVLSDRDTAFLPAVALGGLAVVISIWASLPLPFDRFVALAVLAGGLVGITEIFGRYRDEPFLALCSSAYGWAYTVLNGLIAAVAYLLLLRYGDRIFSGTTNDNVMRAVVAGFGSSAVMRSRFFSVKAADGSNQSVGLDAVIQILLQSLDRGIDRIRARRRLELALVAAKKIKVEEVVRSVEFMIMSLASFQNLTEGEKSNTQKDLSAALTRYKDDPMQAFIVACFGLINLNGEANFDLLIERLRQYLDLPRPATGGGSMPPPASPLTGAAPPIPPPGSK